MSQRYLPPVLLLAAIWGASYLFIKVGVRDFQPPTLMAARLLIAFVPLFGYLALTRGGPARAARELASVWRIGLVLGLVNAAVPFTLIAWGEKHIDSGVAGVVQASVPVFTALLAIQFLPSERATRERTIGIALGLVGVGILTGVNPGHGWYAVAGTLAVVLSSVSYAAGGLYGQTHTARVPGPVLATATTLYGGLLLLPWGLVELPGHAPSWKPIASLLALALAGTAFAQLLLFHVLRLHGAAKLSLVTYLMPPFAVFYGATILGEPLRWSALAGLALILAGVALGSGVAVVRRRAALRTAA
ncbi:MAG TPA: EamA family transporter [Gaiellaceae bacterium]|nr:EamA family transporter [Gaiellaceae bacterium]